MNYLPLTARIRLQEAGIFRGTAGEVSELKIIFNGFSEEIEGCTVSVQDLLDRTREDDPAVIVEINGRYVFRKDFTTVTINEGDRVEFIHPSFGG